MEILNKEQSLKKLDKLIAKGVPDPHTHFRVLYEYAGRKTNSVENLRKCIEGNFLIYYSKKAKFDKLLTG